MILLLALLLASMLERLRKPRCPKCGCTVLGLRCGERVVVTDGEAHFVGYFEHRCLNCHFVWG